MRPLAEDRRGGIAATEFCCVLPMIMLLMLGYADAIQLGRGHLRMHYTATQLGQIVSQCKRISQGDQTELMKAAARMAGTFAKGGKLGVVVTAIGRDSQDKPFTWQMGQRPDGLSVKSEGSQLPPDLTPKANEVVFRTEVFAPVETVFFSAQNGVLRGLIGQRGASAEAYGRVLHMSRAANADGLKTQNKADSAVDCLGSRED